MAQGRIQYEITAKDRSAAALKAVRGNLGQVETAVGGLTRLLAPLAAAFSVGVIGANLVRTNREFQSLKASLITFTGSVENADRAFGIIRKFAADTPFAVSDVVSSFNILVARGIAPTVGQLQTFGDIASGSGKSFQQLAEAVADAAVGEFERLKEFGIKASKENDKITFAFGNTTKTVTNDAASILAALTEIGQAQFAGATERQAATLNGAFSNLGDAVDNLFFSIGEAGLSKEIARVTRRITGAITETDGFARTVSNILVGAIQTAERAFGFLSDNIDEIIFGFGVIFGAKLISNVAKTIAAIVNFTKAIAAASVTTTLFKTVSSLLTKNLALTITTTAAAAAGAIAFKDEIANLVKGITDQIDVSKTIDAVLDALGFTINDTSSETSKLAAEVEELTSETQIAILATDGLTSSERKLLQEIKALTPETVDLKSKLIDLDGLFVKNKVSTDDLSKITQQLALDYTGLTNPTATARSEQAKIEEAIKAVTAAGGDNSETLRLLRSRLIDLKAQTEQTYGAGAIKGIKDYYDSISDNAKNAAIFVGDAFQSLESDLSDFFQTGKLDFNSFKNSIIKGLADIAAKAVISTGINFLGEVFPSLQFAEGGYVGKFASGGFVSGPGGPKEDRILARLSDGEYVMNANSVSKFGRGFFDKLNSGQIPGRSSIPEETFGNLPKFGLGSFIKKTLGGAGDLIGGVVGGVADAVSGVVNGVVDVVGDIGGAILDSAKGLVGGILGGDIGAIAKFALPFILPGLGSGIGAALGQFGAGGFSGVLSGVGGALSNSLAAGVLGAGSTSAIATSVLTGLASDTFTSLLADKISSSLIKGFGGITDATTSFNDNRASAFAKLVNGASPFLEKRAMGGPLSAGQAAMVGENGPEVFIPNRNGTVAAIKGNGGDLIGAVNEVRDEIADLRRQFSRALAGQALVGAR
jgi:hypothetical protein